MIANETAASEAVHCKGRTVLRRSLHSSVLSESTLGALRVAQLPETVQSPTLYSHSFVRQLSDVSY